MTRWQESDLNKRGVRKLTANDNERKKRRADEDKLCMAFTTHCEKYFPRIRGILAWTHVANQGRSKSQGSKLKKMGVYAGVFDYIFWAPDLTLHLEAKVEKRDYSDTQRTFMSLVEDMPRHKLNKFYSVREGHNILISYGIFPIMACTIFKEPDFLTKTQKVQIAIDMWMP